MEPRIGKHDHDTMTSGPWLCGARWQFDVGPHEQPEAKGLLKVEQMPDGSPDSYGILSCDDNKTVRSGPVQTRRTVSTDANKRTEEAKS